MACLLLRAQTLRMVRITHLGRNSDKKGTRKAQLKLVSVIELEFPPNRVEPRKTEVKPNGVNKVRLSAGTQRLFDR